MISKASIKISLLILIIVIIISTLIIYFYRSEGFEDIGSDDYTQKYTKQIEDWLEMEDTLFKVDMEAIIESNKLELPWKKNMNGNSISGRQESLPEDPKTYLTAIKDVNAHIDNELRNNDVPDDVILKLNSLSSAPEKVATSRKKIKDTSDSISLSSLEKFAKRGPILLDIVEEYQLNMNRYNAKLKALAESKTEPETAESIIGYEINKFAKPIWKPLTFAIERLAKVLSLGNNGNAKYSATQSVEIALKEFADKAKVNDIDKFYNMMTKASGNPPANAETLASLFSDPLSYTNTITFLIGKFKEITSGLPVETFMNFTGSEINIKSKCIPCKIEPEVQDLEALKKRYRILKDSYMQFKQLLTQAIDIQTKTLVLEEKAKSGELMTEMIAARQIV
jgi:hypothetical protein